MPRRLGDSFSKSCQAVWLEFTVSVHEYEAKALGTLNPSITGGGNSRVRLPDKCQRERTRPAANRLRRGFGAAIIDNNDFEARPVYLLR